MSSVWCLDCLILACVDRNEAQVKSLQRALLQRDGTSLPVNGVNRAVTTFDGSPLCLEHVMER